MTKEYDRWVVQVRDSTSEPWRFEINDVSPTVTTYQDKEDAQYWEGGPYFPLRCDKGLARCARCRIEVEDD